MGSYMAICRNGGTKVLARLFLLSVRGWRSQPKQSRWGRGIAVSILREMKRVRLNSQARKAFQGSSRGSTLVEVAIAIALLGVITIGFLSSLSNASTVLIIADEQATAESLARSQMEDVKNQPKSASYIPSIPPEYELVGYSANITAGLLKLGLQEITIGIYHHDEELVTLVGYRVF